MRFSLRKTPFGTHFNYRSSLNSSLTGRRMEYEFVDPVLTLFVRLSGSSSPQSNEWLDIAELKDKCMDLTSVEVHDGLIFKKVLKEVERLRPEEFRIVVERGSWQWASKVKPSGKDGILCLAVRADAN